METKQHRILIVDDNRDAHEDFRKILAGEPTADADLNDLEAELFGDGKTSESPKPNYQLDSAASGRPGEQPRLLRAADPGRY